MNLNRCIAVICLLGALVLASPALAKVITGGFGADSLTGTESADKISGASGGDTLRGLGAAEQAVVAGAA